MRLQKFFDVRHERQVIGDFFQVPIPPLDGKKFFNCLRVEAILDNPRRVADSYRVGRNVFRHDRLCTYDSSVANFRAAHNRHATSYPNVVPDDNLKVIRTLIRQRLNLRIIAPENFIDYVLHIERK